MSIQIAAAAGSFAGLRPAAWPPAGPQLPCAGRGSGAAASRSDWSPPVVRALVRLVLDGIAT